MAYETKASMRISQKSVQPMRLRDPKNLDGRGEELVANCAEKNQVMLSRTTSKLDESNLQEICREV